MVYDSRGLAGFFFIFCKMLQSCPLLIHSRNMHTHRTHMHITPVIIRCVRYSCLNVSFFILLFEIWIAHTVCKPKEMNIFNSQIVVVDERRYFAFSGVLCVCTCVCACRDFSAFWIYTYMPVLKEEKKIMFWLPIQRRCRHHHFLHKYTSKRTHTLFVHHCKLLTLRVYIYMYVYASVCMCFILRGYLPATHRRCGVEWQMHVSMYVLLSTHRHIHRYGCDIWQIELHEFHFNCVFFGLISFRMFKTTETHCAHWDFSVRCCRCNMRSSRPLVNVFVRRAECAYSIYNEVVFLVSFYSWEYSRIFFFVVLALSSGSFLGFNRSTFCMWSGILAALI